MALRDLFIVLDRIGFTDVILPFVLVFTVVYAVLQKTKVLGVYGDKPKSNLNAMVAFVLAFFVLIMVQTLNVITWFARIASLLIVVFVLVAMLFALVGAHTRFRSAVFFATTILLAFGLLQALVIAGVLDQNTVNRVFVPVLALLALLGAGWLFFKKKQSPQQQQPRQPSQRPAGQRPRPRLSPEQLEELRRLVEEGEVE
jgi:hypothetical protein